VAKALAANSPWINVLKGGTFASGQGDTVKSVVEMQAAPGDSLAVPTFINDTEVCGTRGDQDLTGKVDFSYALQTKRGNGPKICVKQGFGAFKSGYLSAEDALRKLIVQYLNADVQAQLVIKSATKATADSTGNINSNVVGGSEADIDIDFSGLALPDSPMSFKYLHSLARKLKEELFGEMFAASGSGMAHFRVIGGDQIIESFRDETGVEKGIIALTEGGYKMGETMITAYGFEQSPAYRGLAFGITHRPLRFNTIDGGTGLPNFIDPVEVVSDSATNTAYAQVSQEWLEATYEILVLIADGSFERQTPERYTGEGTFKFAPQLFMGELNWHYQIDNDCNEWGDYGWHKYQITRAYKPLRPQHIIPIMFKRCIGDLGLTPCTDGSAS
jgi:hypothetical protein